MNLTYKENYWNSLPHKTEFISFLATIHRIDLSLWNKLGYWDENYRPFSFFSGETLVSNVCVYTMSMIVRGKLCQVAQISAVGTLEEYRKKGLSSELTAKAVEWAKDNHEFFFLFADDDAASFYQNRGFRPVEEYRTRISVTGESARSGAVKLDMQNPEHRDLVFRISNQRTPVSNQLGASNSKLFMFWCVSYLQENIYYIEEFDLLVLYKREGEKLTVLDIIGSQIPTFQEIYKFICSEGDESVEFHFMADKLALENFDSVEFVKLEENDCHIKGDFPLEGSQYIFPFTAHA